ncbi:MAG: DMT family transporter [Leptolyngbya sp. SIO4C1]|nr:DMT family transporter [Leptolyngbya sp. SIO4C1]
MLKMLYLTIAFTMGAITAIYIPMNSVVARGLGSAVAANILFFCLAFTTTLLISALTQDFQALSNFKAVHPFFFLSGFVSAFMVLGSTFLIPQLGARSFFVLFVAGQILMAMLVSHMGVLTSPHDPITLNKAVGAAFVVAGIMISISK